MDLKGFLLDPMGKRSINSYITIASYLLLTIGIYDASWPHNSYNSFGIDKEEVNLFKTAS